MSLAGTVIFNWVQFFWPSVLLVVSVPSLCGGLCAKCINFSHERRTWNCEELFTEYLMASVPWETHWLFHSWWRFNACQFQGEFLVHWYLVPQNSSLQKYHSTDSEITWIHRNVCDDKAWLASTLHLILVAQSENDSEVPEFIWLWFWPGASQPSPQDWYHDSWFGESAGLSFPGHTWSELEIMALQIILTAKEE